MLTRRSLLATPFGLAAAAAILRAEAGHAAPATFIRYDVASPEGKAMLKTYAMGVKILKAASGRKPQSWLFEWYTHSTPDAKAAEIRKVFGTQRGTAWALAEATWSTCQAHMPQVEKEVFFLPWHRLFVGYLEQMIRTVTKTPAFTLPYWDYTAPNAAAIPAEFRDEFATDPVFGALHMKNRNRDDGGQYANVNGGEPINKYFTGAENFLNLNDTSAAAYAGTDGFNQSLDGNLHGNIHVFVGDGSNMASVPTAAGDPIFWLHHCNIDRIWYAWNKAGGTNPTDASWLGKTFTFADGSGKRVNAAVRTIADITALSYGYDKLPILPNAPAPQVAAAARPVGTLLAAAAAPPTATATAKAPVALGAAPQRVTLTPRVTPTPQVVPQLQPNALTAGASRNERIILTLHGVQAQTNPGIVYKVYLDLPPNAAPDVAGQHFVGLLNFFDKVMMPGHMAHQMAGKDVSFDITDLAERLRVQNASAAETSVTLVPTGTPNAAAVPVIAGGIEIGRR